MSSSNQLTRRCGLLIGVCLLPFNSCDACGGLRLRVQQNSHEYILLLDYFYDGVYSFLINSSRRYATSNSDYSSKSNIFK